MSFCEKFCPNYRFYQDKIQHSEVMIAQLRERAIIADTERIIGTLEQKRKFAALEELPDGEIDFEADAVIERADGAIEAWQAQLELNQRLLGALIMRTCRGPVLSDTDDGAQEFTCTAYEDDEEFGETK